MSIPGTVVQVASSNTTLYALTATGQVYAWGVGTSGQLGDGATADASTPIQVGFPAGVSIASLPTDVMPNAGALAVDTNGNVWAWGDDVHGVDCMGQSEYLTPVELPLTGVTLISSASGHALYEAGSTLYSCGGNSLGELGDGSTATPTGPVVVTGLAGQTVVGLYSSSQDAYALTAAGAIYAWGGNAEDELCNGSGVAYSDVPVQVPFTDSSPANQMAAGGSLSSNGSLIVGLADGTFWACGSDTYGQLGDGGSTNQALPIEVLPPAGVTYREIAMSGATGYAVDSNGNLVNGDELLALFALDLAERGQLAGNTVVVTVMTNLGFRLAMEERGIVVKETMVGDRYVLAALDKDGLSLGGEQSGHIIFRRLATTGDGLLTGLALADLLARAGRPLAELLDGLVNRVPQVLVNVPVPSTELLAEAEAVWSAVAEEQGRLGDAGRVLLRPSGTEPVVRVMVEAPGDGVAEEIAHRLGNLVGFELQSAAATKG